MYPQNFCEMFLIILFFIYLQQHDMLAFIVIYIIVPFSAICPTRIEIDISLLMVLSENSRYFSDMNRNN